MPITTVQNFLQQTLNGRILPLDLGTLKSFILPPNPGEGTDPTAYVWGSHADEERKAIPRALQDDFASGGLKEITHQVDIWVVYFGSTEDPQAGFSFSAIFDLVLNVLRNVSLIQGADTALDPVTGQSSQLLAVGERMSYTQGGVRAVADQRIFRYDGQITCDVVEEIRA